MSIYLVQHGKALRKDEDPLKPLSQNGITTSEFMAKLIKEKGINVSKILHSSKLRSYQTAEIFDEYIKSELGIHEKKGLNPNDSVKDFCKDLNENTDIMVIGHLPFLEKLLGFLITGSEDSMIMLFQNSGVICIDKNLESGKWFIRWTLMPTVE